MVTDTPNSPALLPDRHHQTDLFICDVADAILKDAVAQMEHPVYSLATKPDMKVRRYQNGNAWLEIRPSSIGAATIGDKDLLIYAISQIMAKMKTGEQPSARVKINTRELLIFTNRSTGGKDYAALQDTLIRLEGTRIRTSITTGGVEQIDSFGLIDGSSVRREHGLEGRLLSCEVTLSPWLFNAIKAQEVLTLHRDYFRLRKPIERRIYEIARKHCGRQDVWRIGVPLLLKKVGSQSPEKRFRQMVRHLAEHDHLPDYHVEFDANADQVVFMNRGSMRDTPAPARWSGPLDSDVYADARAVAPGWDPHALEQEWRNWVGENEMNPRNPEGHFVKFCQSWAERRGGP